MNISAGAPACAVTPPGSNTQDVYRQPGWGLVSPLVKNIRQTCSCYSRIRLHITPVSFFVVFYPPGQKHCVLPLRPDSVGGEQEEQGRGRWVYQAGGPICMEMDR